MRSPREEIEESQRDEEDMDMEDIIFEMVGITSFYKDILVICGVYYVYMVQILRAIIFLIAQFRLYR